MAIRRNEAARLLDLLRQNLQVAYFLGVMACNLRSALQMSTKAPLSHMRIHEVRHSDRPESSWFSDLVGSMKPNYH